MGQYQPNFASILGHVRPKLVVGFHFNFNYYNSILKYCLYYPLNYILGIALALHSLLDYVPEAKR